jgi:hypothetical protein
MGKEGLQHTGLHTGLHAGLQALRHTRVGDVPGCLHWRSSIESRGRQGHVGLPVLGYMAHVGIPCWFMVGVGAGSVGVPVLGYTVGYGFV